DDLDVAVEVLDRRAQHVAPDAAETVDAHPDRHVDRLLEVKESCGRIPRNPGILPRIPAPAADHSLKAPTMSTHAPAPPAQPRRRRGARLAAMAAAVVATLAASPSALAWSALGHRLVRELAQRHLGPAARAEVQRLLAGEADPTHAGVADWADRLRDLDPERFKATSKWHYVNTPPGHDCDYV